jgi:hypothetical protein
MMTTCGRRIERGERLRRHLTRCPDFESWSVPKLFIVEEALTTIDEALAMTSRDRDCYDDAALHRLRCELLLLKGATEAEDDEEAAAYMQAMIVFGETEQQITALQQLFAAAGLLAFAYGSLISFAKMGRA